MSREASPVNDVLEGYWRIVKEDSGNFDGWINLLQYVEQLDDTREFRAAFDEFLARFPFCYGYWRKYADMEKRHNHEGTGLEVYESAVKAIPLSIDLWLSYVEYFKEISRNPGESREKKIRSLYEKAIEAAGLEFRSDRLWEDYINWERENQRMKNVLAIYDRLLQVPTLMYSMHFEKVQEFVNNHSPEDILLDVEYYELFRSIESKLKEKNFDMYIIEEVKKPVVKPEVNPPDSVPEDDGVKKSFSSPSTTVIVKKEPTEENVETKNGPSDPPVKTEYRKRFSEEALKLFRLLILDKRRRMHLDNEQEVSKRWTYEDAVKRPYFHVKPLERAQLKNWRSYLDFEISLADRKRIQILFERAVIACAMYEDIWIKYARYMETVSSDAARSVYHRACHIHLPKKPNPRLTWAAFEEKRGHLPEARKILKDFADKYPGLVTIELRRIGLERRELAARNSKDGQSADFADIVKMYESLIRHKAESPTVASFYAVKYARFVAKIKGDRKLAQKILLDAITRDTENVQLHLQLVEIAFQGYPLDQDLILRAFETALDSKIPSMEKLAISQRKLEFLEDLGTSIAELQEHYEWHLKFSKSLGVSSSKKRLAEDAVGGPAEKRHAPEPNTGAAPIMAPQQQQQQHPIPQPAPAPVGYPQIMPAPQQQMMMGPNPHHPPMAGHPQPQFAYYPQGAGPDNHPPPPNHIGGPAPGMMVGPGPGVPQHQPQPGFPHQYNQHGAYYYPPPLQQQPQPQPQPMYH